MNTQPARRSGPLRPLLIVIGLFGIGWLVCVLALWIRGDVVFVYDAKVTDFGVCLTNTQYDPVGTVPLSSQRFYLCGQTAGTTFLPGALTIANAGKVVFSAGGNYGPGYFYQEVVMGDSFAPGNYEAQFGYGRQVVASAKFVVGATALVDVRESIFDFKQQLRLHLE